MHHLYRIIFVVLGIVWFCPGVPGLAAPTTPETAPLPTTRVISLDGPAWLIAHDPDNHGREAKWTETPPPQARKTKVPWIAQDIFPNKHGVFWYWRDFQIPANPHPQGRTLLRFWAADYKADIWLNGTPVGGHEGGESPFVLDVTAASKPGCVNRLAMRLLNPIHQPIDGIVLNETPHRNKTLPYAAGNAWDQGGIMDDVELLLAPSVRLEDIFARPDIKKGQVHIQTTLKNCAADSTQGEIEFTIAPAAGGEVVAVGRLVRTLPPGSTMVETHLDVPQPHLWDLNDPFLYRVTARLRTTDGPASADELSVRTGFRDFRFQDGAFRLNGRRLYLRCSHTGNCCPIGLELPHDPDFLRRDLLNSKFMGFNAIRFISGVARRYQLDLCDEIGLMVYEEAYASWCLGDSPQMARRYDDSLLGMVRRDRNHPSVAMWGLLNETSDGAVFRHAVDFLPALRAWMTRAWSCSTAAASTMMVVVSPASRPGNLAIAPIPVSAIIPRARLSRAWASPGPPASCRSIPGSTVNTPSSAGRRPLRIGSRWRLSFPALRSMPPQTSTSCTTARFSWTISSTCRAAARSAVSALLCP